MTFNVAHENYVAARLSMPLSFDHLPGDGCVSYRNKGLVCSGPVFFRHAQKKRWKNGDVTGAAIQDKGALAAAVNQGKLTKGPIESCCAFT